MPSGIFFLIVIGFFAYKFFKFIGTEKPEEWESIATQLDLTYTAHGVFGTPMLSGNYKGHRIHVTTLKESGSSRLFHTRYRLEYKNPLPLELRIVRQGVPTNEAINPHIQDIETGHPAFDNLLLVQGAPEDAVRSLLTLPTQNAIRDLVLGHKTIITQRHVEIDTAGRDAPNLIALRIEQLRKLADLLQRSAPKPRPAAAPVVPPPIPHTPEPAIKQPPRSPETPPPKPAPEPKNSEPSISALNLETIARDLFGGSAGALMAGKRFNAHFKDQDTEAKGTLLRVERFSYDPIFTNQSGTKATIELCELTGAYSKIRVIAEVAFPKDFYDALKPQTGEQLAIRGRLVAQDAMMHRLFIKSTEQQRARQTT